MENSKKYMAELAGTFVFVLVGCFSIVTGSSIPAIALCFGSILTLLIYAAGPISGCHINPAISFGMFILKRLSLQQLIGYVGSQLLGAITASFLLYIFVSENTTCISCELNLGQNKLVDNEPFDIISAIVFETIYTAVLLITILGATSFDKYGLSGVTIGLYLMVIHVIGIPLTGVSLNPARSIGPALFAGGQGLSQLWIFILSPLAGSILGVLIWKTINHNTNSGSLANS